jgi:hypothetical protein
MLRSISRLLLLVPFLAVVPLVAADVSNDPPAPKGYVCFKAEKSPTIDGDLNDAAWKNAPWSDDFVDIEGAKKPKPAHRTRMKMLWDEKALYVAAEITEPHVWGTITKHDEVIFHDPDFEVFLDPDGDNHLYGELELNALNTTWDLLLTKPYRDGGRAVVGWEIIGLKTAVKVNGTLNDPSDKDTGWTVEIAWPWGGLNELAKEVAPPKDGDRWRVNFSRVEWDFEVKDGKYVKIPRRPEHNWVWSPQGAIDMHRPERWGYLQFSTKTGGEVKYEPDPAQGVQDLLHTAYYAQLAHRKKAGKFATDFGALGLPKSPLGVPTVFATPSGYEMTLTAPKANGGKKWSITHDSRIWSE